MCDWWKKPAIEELPTHVWTQTLSRLREWLGPFHINFNGGEIFLREDMIEILDGIVTNAYHIDRELAKDIVRTNPFNINISLDGVERKTHDGLRGTKGVFEKVMKAIEYIIEFKKTYGTDSRIIIKPTVMMHNLEEMPTLVKWAKEKGNITINFQPIIPTWTDGAEKQFHIDNGKLDHVVDELVRYKKEGAPILNAIVHLESLKSYFRNETLPIYEDDLCFVGVKNYFIHPSGDVYLCEHGFGPVGNISSQSPGEIWTSEKANWAREQIRKCKKSCLQTCTVKRSLRENIDLFQNLVIRNH
jgi:radical SAM protein with 4Fe4S-binding SPASM domain